MTGFWEAVVSAGPYETMHTSLQTDNHTNTSSFKFYKPDALPDTQPTMPRHWKYNNVICSLFYINNTNLNTRVEYNTPLFSWKMDDSKLELPYDGGLHPPQEKGQTPSRWASRAEWLCSGPGTLANSAQTHHYHLLYFTRPLIDWLSNNTHTHTRLTAHFPGLPGSARTRKVKTNLDFTEARHSEWHWHQLGHMQVCTLLQADNHASTPPLSFYRPDDLPAAKPTVSKHWRQLTV